MNSKIRIGPGAASLILMIVLAAMSMLAMLTVTSARNDEELASRSMAAVESINNLNIAAEKRVGEIDRLLYEAWHTGGSDEAIRVYLAERLPEGMRIQDDIVYWTEQYDSRALRCAVRILPIGGAARFEWTEHALITGYTSEDL